MIRQILFICLFVAVLVFVDSYLTLIIGMVMCSLISYCGTKIVVGNWEKMSVYSFVSDTVPNLNETDSNSSLGYSEINDAGQRGDLIEGTYCTRSPSLFIEREELIQESAEMITDQNERAFNLSHCGTKLSHTEEIRTFSKIIFSHYIQTWYKNISQNEDTSEEFSDILNDILETALKNLSRICILDVVEKLIHLYNQHFHHYLQAIDIVKQRHDFVSVKDCIGMETEIHSAYKMSHPALADEPTEWCYLRSISATIIDLLCPQEFLCCNAPYAMLEEILSKNVLSSLVDLFSNPDWLNQMIVVLLSDSTIVTQRFCDAKHFEENICNGKVSNYKNSEKLKVTSAVASTSKQNEHSVYSEVPLHTHLQSVDKQVCPSTRRHSDCEDKNHQHLLRLSLDKRHFPSSTDIYIDYQDISQPSDEIVISYEQHSPETDWESWSNEISVKKETLEISYYSNLSKIKSQSSQDIDNFSLIESEHDCEENEESQEKELKKCQSDDCLSEQSPLPHLVSVNSTNLYLDANNSRASKIADTSFPKKENIGVDEEAEEATEVAWLDLFSDLKIVETEIQEEIGKGTYLLYCIQYSALFCNKEMSPMQYVKSNVLVKRRFREFLALQSRLEDNPKLKKYIKKIKAPNKSIGSFFSPLDKKIVDERKQFLERYLQQLCSYKLIAASSELQEFLAYGSDARIAYVRKPSDIGVPRIDKIFIKGVKGALDMIKTALPGIPQDDSEKNSTIITKGMQGKTSFLPVFGKSKQENYQHPMEVKYIGYNDSYLTQQLTDHIEHFDMHSSEGSIDVRNELPHRKIFRSDSGSSVDVSFILQQEDTSKSAITDQAKFQRPFKMEMPLANAVLDLYLKSIKIFLPYLGNTIITRVLKASFGYYFNRWLAKRILLLFSHEKCVNYLHILHLSLWPEGEETSHKIEKMENPEDSKLHKDAAFIALKLFLPGILNKLLGKTAFEDSLLLFHDSIQYSKLNRCLVYHVLDQLMDHLCAEEKI